LFFRKNPECWWNPQNRGLFSAGWRAWKRFAIPQDITGWWQVKGRSDKPMHLHTEDDLFYIQNYSIWLEILILWKTV